MPKYDYRCRECEHTFEKMMSISNRKTPEADPCPQCQSPNSVESYIGGAPSLGDPVRLGITRPNSGMKEVLQKVQEKSPKATVKQDSNLTRM